MGAISGVITLLLAAGGFLSQLLDFLSSCGSRCGKSDKELYEPLNK